VATKQELAESLSDEQLRSLAENAGLDVEDGSREDYIDAIVSGRAVTVADLEAAQTDGSGGETTVSEEGKTTETTPRVAPQDAEGLAKAGLSPADLELGLPKLALGEPIIQKSSPETPTLAQVEASEQEVTGVPTSEVKLVTGKGEEQIALRPDDAATFAQRVGSDTAGHPAHKTEGHWSNPNFAPMTDEQAYENEVAYAERTGGDAPDEEEFMRRRRTPVEVLAQALGEG
jgi:hypothetical protein